ncbi:hypothetical protein L6R52_02115 [Myxococcota bacterium]|nr:hypothetical protein [Myxococcota bacterium]
MNVDRREFTRALSGGQLDLGRLSPEVSTALRASGVTDDDLRAIAGSDRVIRGDDELGALYDRIVSARPSTPDHREVDLSATSRLYDALRREAARSPAPATPTPTPTAEPPARSTVGLRPAIRSAGTARPTPPPPTLSLELASPLTSTSANASYYTFVPQAMGVALDRLADRYPVINRNFGLRFLEFSAMVAGEVPWMVLSHEAGHHRVADRMGWRPEIEMTGWMSGLTHYRDYHRSEDGRAELESSAAGMNQLQLTGAYAFREWARAGETRYSDAMAYLLAQTNTALYALRSATRGGDAPSSDDVQAYTQGISARGETLTAGQLAAVALTTDLLSAPVWASLFAQGRFLATGERRISIPSFELGPVEATFPAFHTLLSTDGPIVGGHLFLNPRGPIPAELTVDVRLDGRAAAVGAQLYSLPLARDLSMNPFLRLSAQENGPGVQVGSDLRWSPLPGLSVTGTASVGANDLLREVEGRPDGLNFRIVLGFTPPP